MIRKNNIRIIGFTLLPIVVLFLEAFLSSFGISQSNVFIPLRVIRILLHLVLVIEVSWVRLKFRTEDIERKIIRFIDISIYSAIAIFVGSLSYEIMRVIEFDNNSMMMVGYMANSFALWVLSLVILLVNVLSILEIRNKGYNESR